VILHTNYGATPFQFFFFVVLPLIIITGVFLYVVEKLIEKKKRGEKIERF